MARNFWLREKSALHWPSSNDSVNFCRKKILNVWKQLMTSRIWTQSSASLCFMKILIAPTANYHPKMRTTSNWERRSLLQRNSWQWLSPNTTCWRSTIQHLRSSSTTSRSWLRNLWTSPLSPRHSPATRRRWTSRSRSKVWLRIK